MPTSFDEKILNGVGVLSAIVNSGSFAAPGEAPDNHIPVLSQYA